MDYQSLSSFPVVFASGASEATVQIAIANDDQVENTEQFSVVLSSTNNDVLITPRNTATVNIIDTDGRSISYLPTEIIFFAGQNPTFCRTFLVFAGSTLPVFSKHTSNIIGPTPQTH